MVAHLKKVEMLLVKNFPFIFCVGKSMTYFSQFQTHEKVIMMTEMSNIVWLALVEPVAGRETLTEMIFGDRPAQKTAVFEV